MYISPPSGALVFILHELTCLFPDCLVDELQMLPDDDVEEDEEELELPSKSNK